MFELSIAFSEQSSAFVNSHRVDPDFLRQF